MKVRMILPGLWLLLVLCPARASEPLMWQVDSNGAAGQLYLFGSLHYGAENFYPLPERVLSAYRKSDVLAVELDTESLSPAMSRQLLAHLGQYNDDRRLSETLSQDLWRNLSRQGEVLGMNPEQLLRLKPWLAALQLVNMQVSLSEYRQNLGLDTHFLRLAHSKGDKEIRPLETLEQQLALFAGLDERQQEAFLARTLAEFNAGEMQLESLAQAWREGDAAALEEAILGAFTNEEYSRNLYDRVFRKRNRAMAEAAIGYLDEGERVFLVVGVGHLLGDEGLVQLLSARGYRVRRH